MRPGGHSPVVRFFFMHLGTLISIVVYFHVYGASGYSAEGLRSALVTALVVKTGYMTLAYWQGEHKHFDVAIWLLFAVGTAAVLGGIAPLIALYRLYSSALVFTTLGLAALLPVMAGREPFTVYYARRQLPRWQLKTDEFRAISRVMSVYWSVLFFVAAALCAHRPTEPLWTFVVPNALIFGLGVPAQWWLPALHLRLVASGLPSRAEPLIMGMPMVFDARAARDTAACIQFHVRGPDPGSYWIRVVDGRCEAFEGVAESPDLTIHTPEDVWVKVARRELDAGQALADGRYQVEGDARLFVRIGEWFGDRS